MLASTAFSDLPADPREAAGKLLRDLMLSEQTINLSALILHFRDCDLLEVDIEGDGYCLPAGMLSDKTLIVIPSKGHGERRRFTLAHELGHLACHYHEAKHEIIDQERWCDSFASELLMPRRRVDAFAATVTCLADWLKFPGRFEVSRTAAARQLWDYCGVVLVAGQLSAKFGDSRYEAARTELIGLASAVNAVGDSHGKLADGTPCLIRKRRGRGYWAVARL